MNKAEVAKKLQALIANSDSEHEVASARVMLDNLVAKYDIHFDAVEKQRPLRYKKRSEKLVLQVCSMLFYGKDVSVDRSSRKSEFYVLCTEHEQVEAQATYDFYDARYAEELELFMSAFIQRNKIFSPEATLGDTSEETPVERMKRLQARAIAQGLSYHTLHKQLEEKK